MRASQVERQTHLMPRTLEPSAPERTAPTSAPPREAPLTPATVLRLQRTIGNTAVAHELAPAQHPSPADKIVQRDGAPELPPGRQTFINACGSAGEWARGQSDFALSFAEQVGAAYYQAHTLYSKAVEGQKGSDKVVDDLLLDAALAFVPGGKGIKGVLGSAMGEGGNFVVSGAKDIFSTDLEKFAKMGVSGEAAEKFGPVQDLPPVNKNPVQFRANIVARIHDVFGRIHTTLSGWSKEANKPDSPADFKFDPDALVHNAVKIEGVDIASLKTSAESALLLEKGMWKTHVTTQTLVEDEHLREDEKGDTADDLGPGAGVHTGGFKIGRKLRRRINACASGLNENGDDWIRDWGVEMRATWSHGTWGGEEERWHGDEFAVL